MNIQLSVHDWLELPAETRAELAQIFNIPRSKGAYVEQQGNLTVVRSDGTTHEDLSHLTVEKMQGFVNSTSDDFVELFNLVLAKLANKQDVTIAEQPDPNSLVFDEWAATFNRIKGQAVERGLEYALMAMVKQVFNIKTTQNETQGLPQEGKRPNQRRKGRNKTPASVS